MLRPYYCTLRCIDNYDDVDDDDDNRGGGSIDDYWARDLQGEEEILFAPYSVFTVLSVTMPASGKANASNPIVIQLQAAVDNREEPEDLPLSPWN